MKKRQYKVKIENGQIMPLEPFDLTSPKEGIIIFFENEIKDQDYDPSSLLDLVGIISEEPPYKGLTPELIDKVVYDEPENTN